MLIQHEAKLPEVKKKYSAESLTYPIEKFYNVIAIASANPQEELKDTLLVLKKIFLEFILKHLATSDNLPSLKPKAAIILGQIDMLTEKNFFVGKLNSKLVQLIKIYIQTEFRMLKTKLTTEEKENLVTLLSDITHEQQMITDAKSTLPVEIRTGLSTRERDEVKGNPGYQSSNIGKDINDKGVDHFEKHQWKEAKKCFEDALTAEIEIAAELKVPKDNRLIALYTRNLASTFDWWGDDLYKECKYSDAIQNYKSAIETLNTILPAFQKKNHIEWLNGYYRSLARCCNTVGIKYYDDSDYDLAITFFREAITELKKISPGFENEIDEKNSAAYERNLLLAMTEKNKLELRNIRVNFFSKRGNDDIDGKKDFDGDEPDPKRRKI